MSRCEHCEYRNGWECGDEFYRKSGRVFCEDFKLDFGTLSNKQKKSVQKILMKEERDEWGWW